MADEKEYVDVSRLDVVAYTRPNGNTDYQRGFEDGVSFILDKVDNLPREKVEPVVHGHWETIFDELGNYGFEKCSACGDKYGSFTYRYCPNCGAKMDEKEESK